MPQANSDLTVLQTPTVVQNGQVTVAATSQPLSATSVTIKSVTIENLNTNNVVWVGNSAVAVGTGYGLRPGANVSFDIDDLSKVYVVGTAGNVITYLAVA